MRYRLNARPLTLNACHCDACKKMSGGTNLLILTAPREAFSICGRGAALRRTADPAARAMWCAAPPAARGCGMSRWPFPLVTLTAGTLDDPSWGVPASEIWIEKASPAAIFHERCRTFHGQPERQKQLDAFNALYGDA